MDRYDPATVFSSIDARGRYAYGSQPGIAQWNLARFAETLLPLIDADETRVIARATEVIEAFSETYRRHWLNGMRAKLGLFSEEEAYLNLAENFLAAMKDNNVDYTLAFRYLANAAPGMRSPSARYLSIRRLTIAGTTTRARGLRPRKQHRKSAPRQCVAWIPRSSRATIGSRKL